jgi:chromosome segregation ATPase
MTNLSLTAPYVEPRATPDSRTGAPAKAPRADATPAGPGAKPAAAAAAVREERLVSAALTRRNDELLAEQERLYAELQDLKSYINGRYLTWHELHAELVKYRDALFGMDRMVQARDASIARQDAEKRQLELKLQRLETRFADPATRDGSRAKADADLQRQLAAKRKEVERLEADQATLAVALSEAKRAAADGRREKAALADDMKRRDESIAALRAEIEQTRAELEPARGELERSRAALGDVAAAKDELARRVGELEKEITERAARAEAEHDELRRAHEQLRAVQQQLTDRTTQLAASQETLEQHSRQVEEIEAQLHAARRDAEQARGDLERLEAHAEELGRLHAEARAEIERLAQELAARARDPNLADDLRATREQLQSLEQQLADRTSDLAANQAAMEQAAQRSEQLEAELRATQQQVEQARGELDKIQVRAVELSGLHGAARAEIEELRRHHGDARAEIERLERELAARELAAKLEPKLEVERAMVTLLERGVGRMTAIGGRAANGEPRPAELTPAAEAPAPGVGGDGLTIAPSARPATEERHAAAELPPEPAVAQIANGTDTGGAVEAARKLVALSGGPSVEYPLTKNAMTIGRGRHSDIRIDDHFVSRVHAMLLVTAAGNTVIEDAASRNGVFVNSKRITRSVLRDGDVVCLGGELKFRFVDVTH